MWLLVKIEVKLPSYGSMFTVKITLTCDHNPCVYRPEQHYPDLLTIRNSSEMQLTAAYCEWW